MLEFFWWGTTDQLAVTSHFPPAPFSALLCIWSVFIEQFFVAVDTDSTPAIIFFERLFSLFASFALLLL